MRKLLSSPGSILLSAALAVSSASCAGPQSAPDGSTQGGAATAVPSTPFANEYPVIVRLAGRHQTITVTAGPGAPLYSAARPDGTPIVAAVTLEQLRRDHPDVYEQLVPSVAAEEDAAGSRRKSEPGAARRPGGADASLGAFMMMSAD